MSLITRKDLLDAIDKCQGQKNPNANTCIKLAAYYTILNNMSEDEPGYSFSEPPSEFASIARTKNQGDVMRLMDDLMEELQGVAPKLYYETMERLHKI